MDLTKLSDADLLALKAGDYSKMSDDGLRALKSSSAPEASGVGDGLAHGGAAIVNSDLATAKNFFGVGDGPAAPQDPSYVPANVTGGSLNPLKWNYDQIPQKVAEEAPGLTQHIIAGSAGAKLGSVGGWRGKLLGGILGSAASMWGASAGDAAKQDAVDRTGDPSAEPNNSDLTRAGLTSGASALAQAALPMRFIPGANKISAVGGQGLLDVAKKYLATTAIGGATGSAGDAINQIGNTIGTDKGVRFDPSQNANAALGGAATAGVMAAPGAFGNAYSAAARTKFGGANADATAAYNKRLNDAAGPDGLGSGKRDFIAQENTKAGLKNELQQVDDSNMSPDTANALSLARRGAPLAESDVALIEATDPAAGFLARQLHLAQHNETFGTYDSSNKTWSGGLSGKMDKLMRNYVDPTKVAVGAAAGKLMGLHLLGTASPVFAGAAAGTYGVARLADSLTGMRSPANEFAQRFADANAQTRLAPAQPAQAAPPPAPAPMQPSPWGPRPGPTTSVPQVGPAAPPQVDPAVLLKAATSQTKALLGQQAWQQKVKQNSMPTEPEEAPVAAQAPAVDPLMLPRDITGPAKTITGGFMNTGKVKNAYDIATRKAAGIAQAEQLAGDSHAINAQGGLDALSNPEFTKRGSQLLGAASVMKRLTAAPPEEELAAQTLHSAATPPDLLKAASVKAKITKSNGKVNSTSSDPFDVQGGYSPVPEEMLYPKGMTPDLYADTHTAQWQAMHPNAPRFRADAYKASVLDTANGRNDAIEAVKEAHPEYSHALDGLLRQLYKIGNNRPLAMRAINHYAGLLSPEAGAAIKQRFAHEVDRLWPTK